MTRVADIAAKVRSKNAGPFWLTIDIFCETPDAFERVRNGLTQDLAATLLNVDTSELNRFEIADLNVVKLSLPRPAVQGTLADRDMHGASFANVIAEADI